MSREKTWDFKPRAGRATTVEEGDVLGEVQETPLIVHRVLVPEGCAGKVIEIRSGSLGVAEIVARIETKDGTTRAPDVPDLVDPPAEDRGRAADAG